MGGACKLLIQTHPFVVRISKVNDLDATQALLLPRLVKTRAVRGRWLCGVRNYRSNTFMKTDISK